MELSLAAKMLGDKVDGTTLRLYVTRRPVVHKAWINSNEKKCSA